MIVLLFIKYLFPRFIHRFILKLVIAFSGIMRYAVTDFINESVKDNEDTAD